MARAKGGPIDPRKLYIVGEEGPEIFYSGDKSGTVIPNDQVQNIFQKFNMPTNTGRPSAYGSPKGSQGPVKDIIIHNNISIEGSMDERKASLLLNEIEEKMVNVIRREIR